MTETGAWFDTGRAPLQPDPSVALAPRLPPWGGVLGLGLAYAAAAGLSVLISRQNGSIASIWFANALAMGVLMHRAPRQWPASLAALAAGVVAVNLAWGDSLLSALAFLPANLGEVAFAAWLLRRGGLHRTGLRSPVLLLRLLLLGGLLPQLLGATLGASTIALLGPVPFSAVWLAWFEGSVIGSVSVLPLVVCAMRHPWPAIRQQLLVPHMAWLLPVAVGTALLTLGHVPFPFIYLSIPLMVAGMLVEFLAVATLTLAVSVTVAVALAVGVFVPPPTTAVWQQVYVYLAYAAALVPPQLLASAVAELRDHHARLLARTAELARANEGLEQFVRIASHDLREPMNTIVQFTGLIEQDFADRLPEPAPTYLALVRRATQRMRALLDDVLHYTRLQRGAQGEPQPVPLDQLLQEVQRSLAARLAASGGRLQVGPLPVVAGQPTLLELMFQNLVGNALKFVPPGRRPEVTVSSRIEGGVAAVSVRDNGIGIEPQDVPRLFKPFSRLHLRREYEGTGLGLALVQFVVNAHGGRVQVESAPGQGACFTVWLPLAEEAQRARTPASE
jgi:signal transduction histidine kinase